MLIAVNLCRFYSFINKPSIYTYMFKRLQNAKASTLLLEIGPGSRIVCSFLTTILFDGFMRVLWHDALHQRKGFLPSWKTIGQKPETGSPQQPPQVQWRPSVVAVPFVQLDTIKTPQLELVIRKPHLIHPLIWYVRVNTILV